MRRAPLSANADTAEARSGRPCSRNAVSTRSKLLFLATSSATLRTESLADSILDPCAKITIAVIRSRMIASIADVSDQTALRIADPPGDGIAKCRPVGYKVG